MWVEAMVPQGNSTQDLADRYAPLVRQGFRFGVTLTTRFCASRNITSIGKRIKKVCTELQGLIINASACLKSFLPSNPFILLKGVSAITALSARRVFLVLLIRAII